MDNDDKRRFRREKAAVKRDGNRQRRRSLKRSLEENPEEAGSEDEYEFGSSYRSEVMNGVYKDTKRYKEDDGNEATRPSSSLRLR